MTVPLWAGIAAVLIAAVATREDLRTRRIPNRLTFPAVVAGVAAHSLVSGAEGLGSSLSGVVLAGLVLLPGWLLRWMGAGDVKLMAAVGAWIGQPQALLAVLLSLIAGGLLALLVALRRGVLGRVLHGALHMGLWALVSIGRGGSGPPVNSGVRFPFAFAVLAGTAASLFWHP